MTDSGVPAEFCILTRRGTGAGAGPWTLPGRTEAGLPALGLQSH